MSTRAPIGTNPDPPARLLSPSQHPADNAAVRSADRWLIAGALTCGSLALAPLGLVMVAVGFNMLRRARLAGEVVRPLAVSLFAVFGLCCASLNFVGWSFDLLAHDTKLLQTMILGFGRMVDGGYYSNYNGEPLGGAAAAGEKGWAFVGIFAQFPAYIVAVVAFMEFKRWGLRWMMMSQWIYIFVWLGYTVNVLMHFPDRMGSSLYGSVGWWVFNIWYMTPFLTLPWMYTLDKRLWYR